MFLELMFICIYVELKPDSAVSAAYKKEETKYK